MSRARVFPSHDFKRMDGAAIAELAEADIKSLARKWKYAHSKSTSSAQDTAATETAALYLRANHDLYFRNEHQAMKDAHQMWMQLMRAWFLSVFEKKAMESLNVDR